jgi:hypothetical protein
MRKIVSLIIFGIAIVAGILSTDKGGFSTAQQVLTGSDSSAISNAYEQQLSDIQVNDKGKVVHLLPDDNVGSKHQKFILELATGQTILVAHNIDLAPRIDTLTKGDTVEFFGEYEWNDKGGVVHWTHHDPRGKHADGWLRHKGKTYQ